MEEFKMIIKDFSHMITRLERKLNFQNFSCLCESLTLGIQYQNKQTELCWGLALFSSKSECELHKGP